MKDRRCRRAFFTAFVCTLCVLVLAAGVAYAFWQGWLPQQWLAFDWLPKLSK